MIDKFLPLMIFVVLAWFLYNGLGRDTKTIPSPLIDKAFPNLEVEDFKTGDQFTLQNRLKNKVSLVLLLLQIDCPPKNLW
jgi:cytochrome c biogenesis protein CcmG/thiol:disulfide interchange protein DsbE